MEITYKREMKHNYLIIVPEETLHDGYEVRMMASNCIDGLLKFHVKQVDNKKSYYYEITSKQPLVRLLECQSLGAGELRRLMEGISATLERLEAYLLQEGQIWLDPGYIYVEPEYFTVFFCLVPGRQGRFPDEMTALLQYLLNKVNHQDKECVVMAYGLYQESLKENYGMEDLLQLTGREASEGIRQAYGVPEAMNEVAGKGKEEWKNDGKNDGKNGEYGKNREYGIGREYGISKEYRKSREYDGQKDSRALSRIDEKRRIQLQQTEGSGSEADYGDEAEGRINIKSILRNLSITCVVMMGGPALGWLLMGEGRVIKYWYLFLLADVGVALLSAAGIYKTIWAGERPEDEGLDEEEEERQKERREESQKESQKERQKERKKKEWQKDGRRVPLYEAVKDRRGYGGEGIRWQMMFQDEENAEMEQKADNRTRSAETENEPGGEGCSTVLLTETQEPSGVRCLKSMKTEIGDIVISYVPFIIGKQEGLADCILASDAVSRLHARIDRNGEEYRITDLNSTNGTRVGARMLETNEMAVLTPGDEVYIANVGFVFT